MRATCMCFIMRKINSLQYRDFFQVNSRAYKHVCLCLTGFSFFQFVSFVLAVACYKNTAPGSCVKHSSQGIGSPICGKEAIHSSW